MALKIKRPSDKIEATNIKTLLYGEPGIGKTTLALTAPSTLLIDCDAGIRRVDPQFRKDYMEVNSWDDINDMLNSPAEIAQYDTLCIDTVGKLLEFLSLKIVKENHKMGSATGGLTLQGYGALLGEFKTFNAKVSQLGKHIIYIAHDREFTDGEKTKLRPDITGRSAGSILREMDLVGYMQSRNGERTISFTPSDTYYGKNTCNLAKVMAIPDLNKVKVKPMTEIFDMFKKMMDSQAGIMAEYTALLEVVEMKMEGITDVETANSVSEELKTLEEIWDSKTIARIRFSERLSEVGLEYKDKKIQVKTVVAEK